MQVTSYRSTVNEQLQDAKRLIKIQAPKYRWARRVYNEEIAKPIFSRDADLLRDVHETLVSVKSLLACTAEHYANIVRFERECARRKIERKINRELQAYAGWAANGLPVQKERK